MSDQFLFMVAAPVLWNDLPFPLRQAKNIDSSKHLLKTYLFSQAFCLILGTFYFVLFLFLVFFLFLFFTYLFYFFKNTCIYFTQQVYNGI